MGNSRYLDDLIETAAEERLFSERSHETMKLKRSTSSQSCSKIEESSLKKGFTKMAGTEAGYQSWLIRREREKQKSEQPPSSKLSQKSLKGVSPLHKHSLTSPPLTETKMKENQFITPLKPKGL